MTYPNSNDLHRAADHAARNERDLAKWLAKHGPDRWFDQVLTQGRDDLIDKVSEKKAAGTAA